MAAKEKEKATLFFVTVDEYEDHPETGELMLKKPVMRLEIPYINEAAWAKDGVNHPAIARSLKPSQWHGLYTVPGNSEYRDRMEAVMRAAVKKYPNKILGPFEVETEALEAKHVARATTPREAVRTLTAQNHAKDEELETLKAQLAAIESGNPIPPNPPDKPGPKETKDDAKK
jgi:hypothetical protein